MADSGIPILSLPATVTLLDTDVLPLGRLSGSTAPGTNLGITGAALKKLAPTGNSIPGTDKRVRFLTAAQLAAAPDGGDSLDGLSPATLVLGGLAWVEFHPTLGYGVTLRLLYDGAPRTPAGSGLRAYRTGDLVAGDTVPVRWVVAAGPEVGVSAYPQRPVGYVFALNELVRAYVSDVPTEQFFAANFATALPAPTVSAGDANWRAVSPASLPAPVAPLYGGPGTATNGPMTQLATTIALNSRYNSRGAWAATTLYAPLDSVTYNGGTYYNAGAAFTSGAAFVPANWTGFGAGLYTTIDYLNEIRVGTDPGTSPGILSAANYGITGAGGRSYVLTGQTVELPDVTNLTATSIFWGRLFAFRVNGAAGGTITNIQGTPIDGQRSLSLSAGEWIVLKSDFAGGGYTKVMRGTVATPGGGTAFAAITANQYGTHPAFSTQDSLNGYLLGKTTGTAPTQTVTATSATPS